MLQVYPSSPAQRCGLRPQDVILRFAETPIENDGDLPAAVGQLQPGDKATLAIRRGQIELELEVTLGNRSRQKLPGQDSNLE